MANQNSPAGVALPRVAKIDTDNIFKTAYRMARPIQFDGVLFNTGDCVEFNDKNIEHLFIKNNYIV